MAGRKTKTAACILIDGMHQMTDSALVIGGAGAFYEVADKAAAGSVSQYQSHDKHGDDKEKLLFEAPFSYTCC